MSSRRNPEGGDPIEIKVKQIDIRWDFEGDLNEAISFLQRKKTELTKEGYTRVYLDVDTDSDYYGDSSCAIVLKCYRMETSEEVEARLAKAKADKELYDQWARQQIAELKKQLGEEV